MATPAAPTVQVALTIHVISTEHAVQQLASVHAHRGGDLAPVATVPAHVRLAALEKSAAVMARVLKRAPDPTLALASHVTVVQIAQTVPRGLLGPHATLLAHLLQAVFVPGMEIASIRLVNRVQLAAASRASWGPSVLRPAPWSRMLFVQGMAPAIMTWSSAMPPAPVPGVLLAPPVPLHVLYRRDDSALDTEVVAMTLLMRPLFATVNQVLSGRTALSLAPNPLAKFAEITERANTMRA